MTRSTASSAPASRAPRVLLIGGSSHCGKTTLARHVAERLRWTHVRTDKLARHPGRPWSNPPETVPPDVAEHYKTLSVPELLDDVLQHYKTNVWPRIEALARAAAPAGDPVIIEGSAVWPESVATLSSPNVAAVFLTASEATFTRRIHQGSRYDARAPDEKHLIDRFLQRTVAFDRSMTRAARRLRLPLLDVDPLPTSDALADRCLSLAGIRLTPPAASRD
jgi:2-phosphoglycerate kinase